MARAKSERRPPPGTEDVSCVWHAPYHEFRETVLSRVPREERVAKLLLSQYSNTRSPTTPRSFISASLHFSLASSAASFRSSRSTALSTLSTLSPPGSTVSSITVRLIALNAPAGSDGSAGFAPPSRATERANLKMSSFLRTTASSGTDTIGSTCASSTLPLGFSLTPFSM